MHKRVLLAVGGTGGHVYPAIALAKELEELIPSLELFFAGGRLASNRYFNSQGYAGQDVSCGTFSLKKPLKIIPQSALILRGFWQSRKMMKQFKPDLVIGFGSYYTLPLLLAARSSGIPLVLHEQNSIPGKVNRLFSGYAAMVGIHFPMAAQMLRGCSIEVGLPLRKGFSLGSISKEEALAYFNLQPNLPTLLVFGGSQGAKAINHLACETLCQHVFCSQLQVIHLTGQESVSENIRRRYAQAGIRACVKGFEEHMERAWHAVDFALARSGAGTIAEACEFEVPAFLIPYPHAADNHQVFNARYMVDIVKGGIMDEEQQITVAVLTSALQKWLQADDTTLVAMKHAIRDYKKNRKTRNFASWIQSWIMDRDHG